MKLKCMIKENELRVGNIIAFDDGSTDIVKVNWLYYSIELGMWFVCWDKISGDGKYRFGNSILDDFKPIPITPEILIKCGFGHDEEMHKFGNDFNPHSEWVSFSILAHLYGYWVVIGKTNVGSIKYLHQLQNLYFALTGTELDVKLA